MTPDAPQPADAAGAPDPEALVARWVSRRASAIDASGIRRIFELGAKLEKPINLSIGQPDFPVPDEIKSRTIDAIRGDRNGYTLTQGAPELLNAIRARLRRELGWETPGTLDAMVTSGTSGALLLAFMAVLDPGDEVVIPDPYFVIYPALAQLVGARAVYCDTYPDFRMTAERVAALITPRTKMVLLNSPSNPAGVVLDQREVDRLAALCRERGILLVSDEIYDEFLYSDARGPSGFPTPARAESNLLLVRGFGKTYGCTGWRLGWAAGPAPLLRQLAKLQQYTFVCAPSMAQVGASAAFEVDMQPTVERYERRRDMVLDALGDLARIERPGGAFYAFIEVPPRLGLTASAFVEKAIAARVLVIPGSVFSRRDTHFRLSFAAPDAMLAEGLEILQGLLKGG